MKCIVTGGAGFIGSNLVIKLVSQNHTVIVLDNLSSGRLSNLDEVKKKIQFYKIDVSQKSKKLSRLFKNIDWVFHLAGIADIVPSIERPTDYFNTNVNGTLNILELSRHHKVKKFIYAASASCYGIPKKYPTNEKEKIKTEYPYALTKYIGEQIVLHWSKVYKIHCVSLRFFNAYGPKSRTTGAYGAVFGIFLAQKLASKPLTIVGSGNQTRDFIHVFDLVDAIILSAKKGIAGEVYNIASGKEVSVNKVANLIGGKRIKIPKRPAEPDKSLADISKIKKLGWTPKITIVDGVKMLKSEINNWKDAPVWTPGLIRRATKLWFTYLKK